MRCLLAMISLAACASRRAPVPAAADAAPVAAPPGITVERIATGLSSDDGDGRLTLVRIDLARYQLGVYAAADAPLAADEWAARRGLVAVINSSMFAPSGRSIGLLVDGEGDYGARDNSKLGGFLAWDPVSPDDPPIQAFGRECTGFDLAEVRRRYRAVVQNYRLLDCDGKAIAWKDDKVYSAAAIGIDAEGRFVLLHSRTPYRMADLARVLEAQGLVAAHYVEGGPEASLYVAGLVYEVGSFETFFFDGSNTKFWAIPNVIGVRAR